MAFEKKQSKNVKKFHYLERLWPFVNGDDGCGPLKDDRRCVLCGVCGIVGVVVLCKLDERGETRPRSDVMWTSEACELINASWKPDASTVSICSFIDLLEEDSQRSENLVLFDLDRGNSQRSENSVHYSMLRGSVLDSTVEHFFFFSCFCSTFSSARIDFGLLGRTFFLFSLFLFYFELRADRFWTPR